MLPLKCARTRETPCWLPRLHSCILTFSVVRGENFGSKRARRIIFPLRLDILIPFFSIMRAYPALLKPASAIKINCFSGMGCGKASWQASFSALFTEPKVSFNSGVMLIGTSVFESFYNQLSCSTILGVYFWKYFLNSTAKLFSTWGISLYSRKFEFYELVVILPRIKWFHLWKSTCLTPKWHFSDVIFKPAWRIFLKTARTFRVRSAAVSAAIPISSRYRAHWSALTTGFKYSNMKLEKADTDLLKPCASVL